MHVIFFKALLKYSLEANRGVTGTIIDEMTKEPVEKAHLTVVNRNITFYSFKKTGEFWRILLPGKYQLKVSFDNCNQCFTCYNLLMYKNTPQILFPIISEKVAIWQQCKWRSTRTLMGFDFRSKPKGTTPKSSRLRSKAMAIRYQNSHISMFFSVTQPSIRQLRPRLQLQPQPQRRELLMWHISLP